MDRDELQDRIRARRSGSDPYRRGGVADEGTGGYQRFQPEPEDSQARRSLRPGEQRRDAFDEGRAAAAGPPVSDISEPADLTRESDDWADRPSLVPPLPPFSSVPEPPRSGDDPVYVDNYDDAAEYDEAGYPYEYEEWDDGRDNRSSGAGAFAILGFLALAVLALGLGAVFAGVLGGDGNTGGVDPTLTPSPSIQESATPSAAATASPTTGASATPSAPASGEPVVFPDGFTAETQPCIPGSAGTQGCGSNARSNSGNVWIWVGFESGTSDDVIGAEIIGPDGNTVGTGSIDLASIRCGRSCNGWTYFQFGNLAPGSYDVEITRNGDLAGITSFEVT